MHADTKTCHRALTPADREICTLPAEEGTFQAAEARDVSWDAEDLVRRKGRLERLP